MHLQFCRSLVSGVEAKMLMRASRAFVLVML